MSQSINLFRLNRGDGLDRDGFSKYADLTNDLIPAFRHPHYFNRSQYNYKLLQKCWVYWWHWLAQ